MEYIVTSSEMKEYDKNTIEKLLVPSCVLMERAALSVVWVMEKEKVPMDNVLVVCGTGNNGGDGLAVARILREKNIRVTCVLIGDREKCTKETRAQLKILEQYGLSVNNTIPEGEYTSIIDALFGIGLSRNVEGLYKEGIESINKKRGIKVCVDIPSGIHSDTGNVMGCAVRGDLTVTFAFKKLGCLLHPGRDYTGKLVCASIGITPFSFFGKRPGIFSLTREEGFSMPRREENSHKGSFGKVLLVAGSPSMGGAALLCAKAALLTGAGMVKVYTAEENRDLLLKEVPEVLVSSYVQDQWKEEELLEALEWATVIGIGPGLSTSSRARSLWNIVRDYCRKKEGKEKPLLIDGDGLNIGAKEKDLWKGFGDKCIVTPHVKEMARLTGKDIEEIKEDIVYKSQEYGKENNLCCVLKDARTVVTDGKGNTYINQSGNHGMATAGSGDVLSGMILGLLAQGEPVYEGAWKGVYLHGLCGDMAAKKLTAYGMKASHLIDFLPKTLKKYNKRGGRAAGTV